MTLTVAGAVCTAPGRWGSHKGPEPGVMPESE